MTELILSVHDIVDTLLRKGDLDNRIFNQTSMEEGTRLHAWYQSKQNENYHPEVYLSDKFICQDYLLSISGRADGIIQEGDSYIIDEIKTTNADLDEFYLSQKDWHLGQAVIYAYMFAKKARLKEIQIQLTYISQTDRDNILKHKFRYSFTQLEEETNKLIEEYVSLQKYYLEFKKQRIDSIADLPFPYSSMRQGQIELMNFAYKMVSKRDFGLIEAQTGIGKTVSSLYPFIVCLFKNHLDKIFYLTSKNSIREVAFSCLKDMGEKGLKIKAVKLTSKQKICFNEKKGHCNPDECPFAKGYFDKIKDAIKDGVLAKPFLEKKDIEELARKHQVCPFEFQLDLLNYSEVIIGDYNYLFDPHAKLQRFFDLNVRSNYLFLIDECHNLPSRVRQSLSEKLEVQKIEYVIKRLKKSLQAKSLKQVIVNLNRLVRFFNSYAPDEVYSSNDIIVGISPSSLPETFSNLIDNTILEGKKYLKNAKEVDDDFLDIYFQIKNVQMLLEMIDDEKFKMYFTYSPSSDRTIDFNIVCLDASSYIQSALSIFYAGLMFSATLRPKEYFETTLGAKGYERLEIPSPFKKENRKVVIYPNLSLLYKDRSRSLDDVKKIIETTVNKKVGNYFVFFPSYEYLNNFRKNYEQQLVALGYDCYFQESEMSEERRQVFLDKFVSNPSKTCIGFLVLGGIFSEGIDLPKDRLIGAILFSIGLGRKNVVDDYMSEYYSNKGYNGFEYAYANPAILKDIQAAGRVIRSEEDKGVIVFCENRYLSNPYFDVLSSLYNNLDIAENISDLDSLIGKFWKK